MLMLFKLIWDWWRILLFVDPDRFTAFFFWIFPLEAWWFRLVFCFEPIPEALAPPLA